MKAALRALTDRAAQITGEESCGGLDLIVFKLVNCCFGIQEITLRDVKCPVCIVKMQNALTVARY